MIMPQRLIRLLPILTALLALLPFLPTLGIDFAYDDVELLLNDPRIHHPARFGQLWTDTFYLHGADILYRPLASTTFALQWWIHGGTPWAFHLVNLLLHGVATGLVTLLALRLFGVGPAAIAGVLFAVHPSRTEIIGITAYRTESLVTILFVAACLIAWRPWTRGRVIALLVLSLAALLCKEQAIVLPFVLGLIWWLHHRPQASPDERRRAGIAAAITVWALSAYLTARETFLGFMTDPLWIDQSINPVGHARGVDRLLWPLKILGRYVQLLLAPGRMSIDHGGDNLQPGGWRDGHLWLGALGLILIAGLAVRWFRQRNWPGLICLSAAAATYFIISNAWLIIGTHFGERLIYLPSAFLLPLIGRHLATIRPGRALAAVLALAWAAVSIHYALQWTTPRALYFYSMSQQPGSNRMPIVIADEAQLRGELVFADAVLADARQRMPHRWEVWLASARGADWMGRFALADQYLQRAFTTAPARFHLAVLGMSQTIAHRRQRLQALAAARAPAPPRQRAAETPPEPPG